MPETNKFQASGIIESKTHEWIHDQISWTPSDRLEKDIMGKYQLDDKGKAQVQRFHEKHSKGGINKKDRIASLREQFLNKNKKKWESALAFLVWGR